MRGTSKVATGGPKEINFASRNSLTTSLGEGIQ